MTKAATLKATEALDPERFTLMDENCAQYP
jgi:hypothetical protein